MFACTIDSKSNDPFPYRNDKVVTTLYLKLLQGCHKVVRTLSRPHCHKVAMSQLSILKLWQELVLSPLLPSATRAFAGRFSLFNNFEYCWGPLLVPDVLDVRADVLGGLCGSLHLYLQVVYVGVVLRQRLADSILTP